MRPVQTLPTFDELVELAREHGIEHLGVAPAEVLTRAREALHRRKGEGLHAGMEFTYRNPDRSTDPGRAVDGARCVIVGARPYLADDTPPRPDGAQGAVARYAWTDHYAPLRAGLRVIAGRIRDAGQRAVVFSDDNSIVDREVAYLAGIGWFGKNANILLPGAGSWFVLGCVVTTAVYPVATPLADGCGSCHRCLDGCPTGAIVAPGVVDANRCLAWLVQQPGTFPLEYRETLGDRFYGCDDCQTVCPPAVRHGPRHTVALDHDAQAWVDVLDVLDSSDADLIDRYGRWYLAGRDPRWWRRNALIVLGNTGDASDDRTVATIHRYRTSSDPILREHADWAAARLGRDTGGATGVGPGGATALDTAVDIVRSAS
ncbi:MAG TPA: tRNA epoxyqueuosine(34) reductase QueG [Ilumatobacteraceae bacterium]|nr:tRNA epoxyqueuosine(34) reductase QueG [Ilumatobacteraceae bacterium]